MSEEAALAVAVPQEIGSGPLSATPSSPIVSPSLAPSSPILSVASPSDSVAEVPKNDVPAVSAATLPFEVPTLPQTAAPKKKERPKLVLATWQPEEGVTECFACKRSFNPLLLRFKKHCLLCGNIFCGSCIKITAVQAPGIPPELPTCIPCHETELARQAKEAIRKEKRDALKLEAQHFQDLSEELRRAFEANDEAKLVLIKSELDRLRDNMIKREQAKQELKAEKLKLKEEKKVSKTTKKSSAAVGEKANGVAMTSGAGVKTKKGAKTASAKDPTSAATAIATTVSKKPLDTPETIALKLEQRYGMEPSKLLNPPTDPTRKCLVLDIDYTLFDHKWQPQVRSDRRGDKTMIPLFKRPYLHEFLEICNSKYDIIIWSATGMPAIDNKVGNLGIYTSTRYKLTAVFCKDHMIHVTKPRKGGRTYDETVKPLSVIWKLFPSFYNPQNTVHIDDMISNFQLNQGNGIHILPYKESSVSPPDTELLYLTKYLMLIAHTESDFSALPHRKWKEWLIDRLWTSQHLPHVSFLPHNPDPPIDPSLLIGSEPVKAKKTALSPPRPSTPATIDSAAEQSQAKTTSASAPVSPSISTLASPRPLSTRTPPSSIKIPSKSTSDLLNQAASSSSPSSPNSTPTSPSLGSTPTSIGVTSQKSTTDISNTVAVGTPPEVRSWVRSAVPRNSAALSPSNSSSSLVITQTTQNEAPPASETSTTTPTSSETAPGSPSPTP
jgi:HAD-superfamily hydrolase (TIGR02245 family)